MRRRRQQCCPGNTGTLPPAVALDALEDVGGVEEEGVGVSKGEFLDDGSRLEHLWGPGCEKRARLAGLGFLLFLLLGVVDETQRCTIQAPVSSETRDTLPLPLPRMCS